MSKHLSSSAIQQFDDEVKHAYQSGGQGLSETVRVRNNVTGDTYNFRKMGAGAATERGPSQSDVTPMDVSHTLVPCTLTNWIAAEYTDIFDAAEVNIDERSELASTIANAMKRRKDQMILDALAAATPAATVATGAAAFTVAHLT
ncbi:MAG: hypothetical protein HKP56_05220, partial [Anderseniella sp.]|nr:hypothetical protein [Anderseniella sp.]